MLVSSLLADYFFIAPYFHLWPVRHGDLVYLVTVAIVGPVLSALSELMHRARRRVEISLEELTQQAARLRTNLIDRKRTEEALRRSLAQMAGVIGSAMDAIITVDSEQRILLFNTAAEKMFCCSTGEAVGQALNRFIPERFRHAHSAQIRSFGETGVTTRAVAGARTIYGLRTNGEEFPLEASISQLESDGQKLYTVILRDNTERKRAEEALHASEAQLQTIVEGLNAHIPIIAMTAHAMDGDRQRCLDAGMDRYLAKPIRAKELLQSIENLMAGLAEAAPVVRDPLSNSALLDHAALLEFVGGNEELLRAVIGVFLKNCPDLVTNIRFAVAEGDCAALKLAAHTIRGSASTFLTAAAIQAATRLEQMGRESQLLSAEDELSTLEEEIARVELELNALATGSSK